MQVERVASFLAKTALFKNAPPAVAQKAAPLMQALDCAESSVLVAAGKVSDGLGIVFSGAVQVLLPGTGGELTPLETLGPGDFFGEVSALLGEPSPFFAVVSAAAKIFWLPAQHVQAMVAAVPAVAEALARRLARYNLLLAKVERSVAPELMSDLESQLLEALAPHESTRPAPVLAPEPVARGIPFVELREFDLSPSVLAMVPVKLVRTYRLLPVKLAGNVLTVAMVNPRDGAGLGELRRTLQTVEVVPVAIGLEDYSSAVVRLKLFDEGRPGGRGAGPRVNPESLQFETVVEQERETARDARAVGDDVIRLFNRIVAAAIEREASDIHIEPTPQSFRVRFRTNGTLTDWNEPVPPTTSLKAFTARVKVLAGLDITERRLPQDGRIGINAGRREIDLRVSTLPANRGEKLALRVLEAAGSTRQLEQIFFEPLALAAARKALNRPYGGIIIAGPTGSGKTSTLYSLLNERKTARPDTNIIMVEDPIEYRLPGVTQVQVNAGVGLGFAQALRSILRQDPDVIVVGEMRDQDTARTALEAAMTGHLVLTSLHANNAFAALQRLENLGCGRALIAQSIHLVLVQRLVRKLCNSCRKLDTPTPALLESLLARHLVDRGQTLLPRAVGCDACGGSGYVGRTAVVEVLQLSDALREALTAGRSMAEVQHLAEEQGALLPFSESAKALLRLQLISASEVLLSLAE